MEGRIFEMFSKNQKTFKNPKTPKIVPKLSKSALNMFWGTFRKVFFCPVFHVGSSLRNDLKKSKFFKIAQKPKVVPKSVQTCFEHVLG